MLFKIKSKDNLVTGDMVQKAAKIYFDYNAPIDTNIAQTTYQSLNNPILEFDDSIKVFPNPAQKYLHLSGIKEKTNVQITDLNGKLIQSFNTDIDRIINIENLASSIYILCVRNLETQAIGTIKFIKN